MIDPEKMKRIVESISSDPKAREAADRLAERDKEQARMRKQMEEAGDPPKKEDPINALAIETISLKIIVGVLLGKLAVEEQERSGLPEQGWINGLVKLCHGYVATATFSNEEVRPKIAEKIDEIVRTVRFDPNKSLN